MRNLENLYFVNIVDICEQISILKHEKEILSSSEERASAEVRSLSERVHRLQVVIVWLCSYILTGFPLLVLHSLYVRFLHPHINILNSAIRFFQCLTSIKFVSNVLILFQILIPFVIVRHL